MNNSLWINRIIAIVALLLIGYFARVFTESKEPSSAIQYTNDSLYRSLDSAWNYKYIELKKERDYFKTREKILKDEIIRSYRNHNMDDAYKWLEAFRARRDSSRLNKNRPANL